MIDTKRTKDLWDGFLFTLFSGHRTTYPRHTTPPPPPKRHDPVLKPIEESKYILLGEPEVADPFYPDIYFDCTMLAQDELAEQMGDSFKLLDREQKSALIKIKADKKYEQWKS